MNVHVFIHSFWFARLWQGFFLIPCKNHCSDFKPWSPEEGAVHSPPNTAAKTDQWLNRHCCTPWTRDSSPLLRLHIPPAGKGNFRTGTQGNIQLKYLRLNGTRGLGYLLPIKANPTCFVNVYPASLLFPWVAQKVLWELLGWREHLKSWLLSELYFDKCRQQPVPYRNSKSTFLAQTWQSARWSLCMGPRKGVPRALQPLMAIQMARHELLHVSKETRSSSLGKSMFPQTSACSPGPWLS